MELSELFNFNRKLKTAGIAIVSLLIVCVFFNESEEDKAKRLALKQTNFAWEECERISKWSSVQAEMPTKNLLISATYVNEHKVSCFFKGLIQTGPNSFKPLLNYKFDWDSQAKVWYRYPMIGTSYFE